MRKSKKASKPLAKKTKSTEKPKAKVRAKTRTKATAVRPATKTKSRKSKSTSTSSRSRQETFPQSEDGASKAVRADGLLNILSRFQIPGLPGGDIRELLKNLELPFNLPLGNLPFGRSAEKPPPPVPTLLDEEMANDPTRHPCPSCERSIKKDATQCPHCHTPFFTCPYCKEDVYGILDKQMEREFELNRLLKSYTLLTLALPSMPYEKVYACNHCNYKIIMCPSCDKGLKHTAYICLKCRTKIKRTRLFVDPANLMEQLMEQIQALQTANQLFAPPPPAKKR